jgi:hypothetical protein
MKFKDKHLFEKIQKFFIPRTIKPILKKDAKNTKNTNTVNDNSASLDLIDLPEVTYDLDATKKYSRVLKNNEKVIASGVVLKHEKIMAVSAMNASTKETGSGAGGFNPPKQRRILLVTDTPKLMFVDTIGSIIRGHLELHADMKAEVRAVSVICFFSE